MYASSGFAFPINFSHAHIYVIIKYFHQLKYNIYSCKIKSKSFKPHKAFSTLNCIAGQCVCTQILIQRNLRFLSYTARDFSK